MEPTTVVLGLAAIIGKSVLTKMGENITDNLTQHIKNYHEFLKKKAPDSTTVKALESDQLIDYVWAKQELELVFQDTEAIKLVKAIETELEDNPKLFEWIKQELDRRQAQLITVENWKGLNVKGGINTIKDNTFNL
jgi:hypothetical protein